MSDYLSKHVTRTIPQNEQENPLQVKNNAGGFTFQITPEKMLERFLILGSEGGTYYAEEKDLTQQNLTNLKALVTANQSKLVVDTATDISVSGRSYKNDTAIFSLAYVMTFGSDEAKSYARTHVNDVVRPFTHLALLESYMKALAPGSGLGTSRNRAIADWYNSLTPEELAYQAVKYRQRYGWTHRDSLRQARPTRVDENVAKWILGKADLQNDALPAVIAGFEALQAEFGPQSTKTEEGKKRAILEILNLYPMLPWEALPTQAHKFPEVWKKLFYNGQLKGQALLRNITRLARLGAFDDLVFARDYADRLTDKEAIARGRIHPIQYLNALVVHTEGQVKRAKKDDDEYAYTHGVGRREKNWTESPIIVDALNYGYKLAFASTEPSNKRTLLALDVSGSMNSSFSLGLDLTCSQVSGAMASVIASKEPYYQIMGFADRFRDLGLSASMDLMSVMRKIRGLSFGRTDCSLPMTWAMQNKLEFDTFIVLTDNETWHGIVHPHVALKDYRQRTGIDAKLIVVAATPTEFSIANPNDAGMLDMVGADSNLPRLVTQFAIGEI